MFTILENFILFKDTSIDNEFLKVANEESNLVELRSHYNIKKEHVVDFNTIYAKWNKSYNIYDTVIQTEMRVMEELANRVFSVIALQQLH